MLNWRAIIWLPRKKIDQVRSQIEKYVAILTDTTIIDATLEAIIQDQAGYEDTIQIKL